MALYKAFSRWIFFIYCNPAVFKVNAPMRLVWKFLSKRCRLWVAKPSFFFVRSYWNVHLGNQPTKKGVKKLGANFKRIKIKVGNCSTNCLAFYKKQKLFRSFDNFLLKMLLQQVNFPGDVFAGCWHDISPASACLRPFKVAVWGQPRWCFWFVCLVVFFRGRGWVVVSESESLGWGMADGRFVGSGIPIINTCITATLPKLNVISPKNDAFQVRFIS